MTTLDPDRFFDFQTPGAQEWWYFDAISDDGRDAIVVVWYAALPFDPQYGVGTLRHLADPSRRPAPRPSDHCAIGLHWYRDGKTVAYALNGYRAGDFAHHAGPWGVEVAGNRVDRREDGYRLRVGTPAVDGRSRIEADLRFRPAPGTEPFEVDLGHPGSPHFWIAAAPDCRVEGRVAIAGRAVDFGGRGYHDHNAGSEEISRAMRRWRWGRFHHGPLTEIYYQAEPREGGGRSLWLTCRDGRPGRAVVGVEFRGDGGSRNVFGVRDDRTLRVTDGPRALVRAFGTCVDDGPFYRRWLASFSVEGEGEGAGSAGLGLCEVLDTANLHRPMFNWMIGYRLKRPTG